MSETVEYIWYPKYRAYETQNMHGESYSYYDEPSVIDVKYIQGYYSYHVACIWHRNDAPARMFHDDRFEWYNIVSRLFVPSALRQFVAFGNSSGLMGVQYNPKCQKL